MFMLLLNQSWNWVFISFLLSWGTLNVTGKDQWCFIYLTLETLLGPLWNIDHVAWPMYYNMYTFYPVPWYCHTCNQINMAGYRVRSQIWSSMLKCMIVPDKKVWSRTPGRRVACRRTQSSLSSWSCSRLHSRSKSQSTMESSIRKHLLS